MKGEVARGGDQGVPATDAEAVLRALSVPDHVPQLFDADLRVVGTTSSGAARLQLGSDGGGVFVLDLPRPVAYWVAADTSGLTRFVNSTVSLFTEFLKTVGDLRGRLPTMDDQDGVEEVRVTRERLRARDAEALATGDACWSVVFEQMTNGLL